MKKQKNKQNVQIIFYAGERVAGNIIMLQILVSMQGMARDLPAWRAGHLLGKAKASTSAVGESTEVLDQLCGG